MSIRRKSLGFTLAALLAATSLVAVPGESRAGVAPAATPSEADAQLQRLLDRSVSQHVAASGLNAPLRGYVLSSSLLQLRRYVDPGQKNTKFVCVVGLSLQNEQRQTIAEIRGNAATASDSQAEAIDAAAHSAVLRVADTLAALKAGGNNRWAQR